MPNKLGGRQVTLTCRRCNNDAGSKLESHLVQRVLVEAHKRPVKTRIEVGGAVQRAEMLVPTTDEEAIHLEVIEKQSDPRQAAEAQRHLSEAQKSINLQMNFGYKPLRSAVAVLRAGYLKMFQTFGYSYVLDPSATGIRAQLENEAEKTPVLSGIMWKVPDPVPIGTSVAIMTKPVPIASFVVLLELSKQPAHVAAVAFPPPGTGGRDFYSKFQSNDWAGPKKMTPVIPEDPALFLPLVGCWEEIRSRHF